MKKVLLKTFAKFAEKHQCWSLFLKKPQVSVFKFIKKETQAQVFSREFCTSRRLLLVETFCMKNDAQCHWSAKNSKKLCYKKAQSNTLVVKSQI